LAGVKAQTQEDTCRFNISNDHEILTKAQAASFLQCSPRQVDYLRGRGLPWIRLGGEVRFFREDILSYLKARKVGK